MARVQKVSFIIASYPSESHAEAEASPVARRFSHPVKVFPLVQGPRWWMQQLRDVGYLKQNERIIGFVPEEIIPE